MDNTERNGEYVPAGEESGTNRIFRAEEIASAFGVEPDRVYRALKGEFGSDDMSVDSTQAQHLAEVLLGDQPQDQQIAALGKLGAYTPRPDHVEGLGEKDPEDECDKLVGDINDDEEPRGPDSPH